VALILGIAWGTYLAAQHYFKRDYQLRMTNWTNVTQLFNRGGGNFGLLLNLLVCSVIGMIVIVSYSVLIYSFAASAVWINVIVLLVLALASGALVWYNHRTFWRRLD
jgi:ABC-2 type transport system permease protein